MMYLYKHIWIKLYKIPSFKNIELFQDKEFFKLFLLEKNYFLENINTNM